MVAYILSLFLAMYLPFEPIINKWVPDEWYVYWVVVPEALILLGYIAVLFKRFVAYRSHYHAESILLFLKLYKKEAIATFVFLLWVLLVTFLHWQSLVIALVGVRQIARFIAYMYLLWIAGVTKQQARIIFISMAIMVLIQASLGLAQVALPEQWTHFLQGRDERVAVQVVAPSFDANWIPGTRATGTLLRYDRLGIFLVLGTILLVAWRRYALAGVVILALMFTYSRTAWLGALAALGYMLLIHGKTRALKIGLACVAVAGVALTLYAYSLPYPIRFIQENYRLTIPQRIVQTFSRSEVEISMERYGRLYFWGATVSRIVAHNFFTGVGPGRYGGGAVVITDNHAVYDEYDVPFGIENKGGQIDNNWLSLLGELGVIGVGLMLAMLWQLLMHAREIYTSTDDVFQKRVSLAAQACIVAYAVFACFGPYFELKPAAFYFWTIAGLGVYNYEI